MNLMSETELSLTPFTSTWRSTILSTRETCPCSSARLSAPTSGPWTVRSPRGSSWRGPRPTSSSIAARSSTAVRCPVSQCPMTHVTHVTLAAVTRVTPTSQASRARGGRGSGGGRGERARQQRPPDTDNCAGGPGAEHWLYFPCHHSAPARRGDRYLLNFQF